MSFSLFFLDQLVKTGFKKSLKGLSGIWQILDSCEWVIWKRLLVPNYVIFIVHTFRLFLPFSLENCSLMNICLKILARLIVIAMRESVADLLNVSKKYIQVHSLYGDFIFKFPSINVLPFCILFLFRLLNNNELRAIPDGAFQNLTDLEYMYVGHLPYFPSFLKYNYTWQLCNLTNRASATSSALSITCEVGSHIVIFLQEMWYKWIAPTEIIQLNFTQRKLLQVSII